MRDIQLLRPHTHAGTALPADAVLTVDDATADWLLAQRIGVVAPPHAPGPLSTGRRATIRHPFPHRAATDTTGDDHEH